MHMDFLFRSTFSEMELHRVKVNYLKCTVQRVLTIYTCATVSTLKLYNVTHHPKRNSPAPLQLISAHTWPPNPRQLLVCFPSLWMNFAYSRVHTDGIILWIIFVSDFFPLHIMLLRSFTLLYGWIYKFVYPFSCGGTFGLFPQNYYEQSCYHHCIHFFLGHRLSFLLSKYFGAEYMCHMVSLYLALFKKKKTAKELSKVVV